MSRRIVASTTLARAEIGTPSTDRGDRSRLDAEPSVAELSVPMSHMSPHAYGSDSTDPVECEGRPRSFMSGCGTHSSDRAASRLRAATGFLVRSRLMDPDR